MKRGLIVIALILIPFLSGCPEIRPTVTENGPGVEIIIGGETAKKIEDGVDKIEGFVKTAETLLPVLVTAAEKIGDATGNEDLGEDAKDVAEKGMAGLGLLTLVLGVARNLTKKREDD